MTMTTMDRIRIESELVGNLRSAIDGGYPQSKPDLTITVNLAERSLIVVSGSPPFRYPIKFYVKSFLVFRNRFITYIDPAKFTFDGVVYHPRKFPIQLCANGNDFHLLYDIPVYYYWPRGEWLCWRHSRRYTRIVAGVSAATCKACAEELRRLKQKYRGTVCNGCRHNYYNFARKGDAAGVAVDRNYGCWFLRDIKRGQCPHYSK